MTRIRGKSKMEFHKTWIEQCDAAKGIENDIGTPPCARNQVGAELPQAHSINLGETVPMTAVAYIEDWHRHHCRLRLTSRCTSSARRAADLSIA